MAALKYVLIYDTADDFRSKAQLHFAAHRARWAEFQARGTLLLIGPFTDPEGGAMAVFTAREAAEEFARSDPFVLHGIVRAWHIREWNEALASL